MTERNYADTELTSLTLNKDEAGYYLTAKIKYEITSSVQEVDIPKIRLPINEKRMSIATEYDQYSRRDRAWVDLGFGKLPLEYDMTAKGFYALFTTTILENKVREMTLNEIEKKLGHKIKIVNE